MHDHSVAPHDAGGHAGSRLAGTAGEQPPGRSSGYTGEEPAKAAGACGMALHVVTFATLMLAKAGAAFDGVARDTL